MEKELTAQESLQLIEGIINKAKNKYAENGFLYLLWGWVILCCALIQFFLIQFSTFSNPQIVWASTWLVVIYQIIYLSKKEKNKTVKTYTDDLIGNVWMVFALTMFIAGFILGRNNHWNSIYPLIIGLYGMPTFLSGSIMKFKPLKIGAICCWILSITSVYVPIQYSLILLAVAVFVAWIIPGYILRNKFLKENN